MVPEGKMEKTCRVVVSRLARKRMAPVLSEDVRCWPNPKASRLGKTGGGQGDDATDSLTISFFFHTLRVVPMTCLKEVGWSRDAEGSLRGKKYFPVGFFCFFSHLLVALHLDEIEKMTA
ncbi:hypothetical protein K2173_007300 [Erythroxylum novogranatense]|uniref:Uncharacterized protein n=1 Tax=Erythroxylum novogranatense TaxID=1862640 RepID=A0AAV8T5T9_9ROSI|nr:hypothetical protein K2173_007300 [Erythroxylum novogranatense]